MRILFVNPIVRYFDYPRHVPIGILQLLAILERDYPRIQFQLYDANAHRVDDVARGTFPGLSRILLDDQYDIIAIGGLITAYNYIRQALRLAKQIQPHAATMAGGGFFSAIPNDIMELIPEIDYGIIGEAYQTLPELIQAHEAQQEPKHVRGIVYRNGNELVWTDPRELIPDMDWLPFPAYKYAPLEIYFQHSGILMSEEAMKAKKRLDACMSLSCPFICRFCWDLGITSIRGLKKDTPGRVDVAAGRPGKESIVRQHSAEYIGRYIQHLRASFSEIPYGEGGEGIGYPIDFVAWVDENIVAHDVQTGRTWLREIEDELWRRGLIAECLQKGVRHDAKECSGPHFGGTSHAGLATKELLTTLKRIGFTYLDYGLEHFSRRMLQQLGKGASPESNARAITLTLQAGIAPIPNQIIMMPGETWESLNEMLDAWEKTGIVNMPFICTPYPGAEWYEKYKPWILEQYGNSLEVFIRDLEDATKVTALLTRDFSPAEAVGIQHIFGQAAKTGDFKNARRLLQLSEACHVAQGQALQTSRYPVSASAQ